jgi:hypothetical protein
MGIELSGREGWKYNDHVYVPVPKCGKTTFIKFFEDNGWLRINISKSNASLKYFGFIIEPISRHTKGVIEYLQHIGRLDLLNDAQYWPMIAAGVFDGHTAPMSCYVPNFNKVHWIPIDIEYKKYNSTSFVNWYFDQHKLPFHYTGDKLNVAWPDKIENCRKLNDIKSLCAGAEEHLVANMYTHDRTAYWKAVDLYKALADELLHLQ